MCEIIESQIKNLVNLTTHSAAPVRTTLTVLQLHEVLLHNIMPWLEQGDYFNICQTSKLMEDYVRITCETKSSIVIRLPLNINLRRICVACPNLEETLFDPNAAYEFDQETFRLYGGLKKLKVSGFDTLLREHAVEEFSLKPMIENCHALTCIDASWFGIHNQTPNLLELIAENLPNLTTLSIQGYVGGNAVTNDEIVRFIPKLSALQVLYISSAYYDYDSNCLSDEAVLAIASSCPSLKEIRIGDGYPRETEITDTSIRALIEQCPKLVKLEVPGLVNLTDELLTTLFGCTELTRIDLSFCTMLSDTGIIAISKKLPWLRRIDLMGCNISDEAVVSIAKHCPCLHSLVVSDCVRLTDIAISAVTMHCTLLEHIDVDGCTLLTASAITMLSQCTVLRRLNVSSSATDAAIQAIASQCVHLQHVELVDCPISDQSLVALAACTQLRQAIVFDCPAISDHGVAALSTCRSLEHLEISDCPRVGDAGVKELARNCRRLHHICIFDSAVTGDSALSLVVNLPLLHTLELSDCEEITQCSRSSIAAAAMQRKLKTSVVYR